MDCVPQIEKSQWIDELKKLNTSYKSDERALIQSFLQDDYHLSKIYKTMLKDDIIFEGKAFMEMEKRLKFSINDAFSYFKGLKATRGNNIDIRNKIRLIEEMILKIRSEFKSKFESLLIEEDSLEKELNDLDAKFTEEYSAAKLSNDKHNDQDNIPQGDSHPLTIDNSNGRQGINQELIDAYIQKIMSSANIIFEGDNDHCSLAEIEKLLKKYSFKDLNTIKQKANIIDSIIENNLGGINVSWQQKEHEDFLKLRTSHNNKINTYEFLNELSSLIPYLPLSELKNHIRKFDKFVHLITLKKILIQKYKDIKAQKDAEDKQKVLEKLKEDNRIINTKNNSVDFENSQVKKMKLKEWKEKKEKEQQDKIERSTLIEREKREKEMMQYINKKEQNKQMLDDYKKKKQNEKIVATNNANYLYNESYPVDPIDIERIKEREEALLEKKKNAVRAKSSKNFKKEENYQKYRMKTMVKFDKMETKINQTTEDFSKKARPKFDPKKDKGRDACTMANNVLNHMSRAVPQWRKGL